MTPRLQMITPVFPPAVGGIESLSKGLAERWPGPVEVLTLEEPGWADWDAAASYSVRRAGNVPRGGRRSMARLTATVAARTRSFRPDVVLSMHVRCGYAAVLARALSGATWLQYYHAKEIPTWAAATRLCARRADHHIPVSHYTRSLLERVARPAGPVSVIPPGINRPDPPGRPRRTRPTILTVARIDDAYKGHDVLLDALPMVRARVPDVVWVVVGRGDRLPWLREQVDRRGLTGCVELRGAIGDAERDDLLAGSHVFALPSRTGADGRAGEGFGIVYAEAAAAGLPVVAANTGGAVDAVRSGLTGLLVDPASPPDVAAALLALLTDDDRRTRMAEAARDWSRRFDWATVAGSFLAVALPEGHDRQPLNRQVS